MDRPQPSRLRLLLSGLFCVCAVASRAPLAVPVGFLALMLIWWLLRAGGQRTSWQVGAAQAGAFLAPLLLGAVALAWYNFVRFDSILEFGYRYQLTVLDQNKYHNQLLSPAYIAPNLYIYLLNAPALDDLFPFIRPIWNQSFVVAFEQRFHSLYNSERLIGLLYAAPFALFSLIPPALAVQRGLQSRRAAHNSIGTSAGSQSDGLLQWFVLLLIGLLLLELLLVFLVFYGTMRYFMDAAPTLAILSVVGFWLGYRKLASRRSWLVLYAVLAVLLLLSTLIVSVLAGFSSDIPRMKAANPSLLPHARLFFISLERQLNRLMMPGVQ